MSRPASPSRDSLGFLVADIARLMRRAFARRLKGSSLTLAQARALVYVSRNEGLRQVELAAQLEVQPITLARLIDQLEKDGLVERRADPADRRAYRLHLKPAAAPHLAAIGQVAKTIRSQALRDMEEREAAAMHAGLQKIHQNLSR
jgi:DNA-binding MarR family transcriptional regulator